MSDIEVKFSKQELNTFAKSSDTCVTVQRKTRVLYVNPAQFSNLSSGIRENLNFLLLKYDFLFKAIILGYNRMKILSRYGSICYGRSKIALQVEADFYLFNPEVGSKLQGVVCKRSGHHLGCLVHKAFNVFLPINEDDYMTGWDFSIGQDVIFTVVSLDLTSGPLPYIRGHLFIEEAERTVGVGSKVDKDSDISYGHEDETGGWDSGVALSSPGRDTVESESLEKEDDSRTWEKLPVSRRKQSSQDSSLENKETQKRHHKLSEMSSDEEENEASKTKASDIVGVLSSPRKHIIEDEKTKEDDEKSMRQEGSSIASQKPAPKKRKSILKNEKEDSLQKKEDLIKDLFKTTEKSFGTKETEVSKKDNPDVLSSPRKHAVESGIMVENEPNRMMEETPGRSVMSPKQTPKKRKSILKNKKEDNSKNEDMIKELLKNMEMSFEEGKTELLTKEEPKESINIEGEQKAVMTHQNLSPVKNKSRSSLGAASKDSEKKKKKQKSPIGEERKMTSPVETLVEKSISDKILESSRAMESNDEEINEEVLAKLNDLDETMPIPQSPVSKRNRKSLGKNKESKTRSSVSEGEMTSKGSVSVNEEMSGTSEEMKKEVDVVVEKLLAMNKALLGIDSLASEGDKLSSEEKKTKKRKRESKDTSESPQRKKVARKSVKKEKSPKVLKSESSLGQSRVMNPQNVDESNISPQSQPSANTGASIISLNSESSDALKSTSVAKKDRTDLPKSLSVSKAVKKSASHSKVKRKSAAAEVNPNIENHMEKLLREAMQAQNM